MLSPDCVYNVQAYRRQVLPGGGGGGGGMVDAGQGTLEPGGS